MKIENQVVSLDLAKQLKETGYPQKWSFAWIRDENGWFVRYFPDTLEPIPFRNFKEPQEVIAAPTVAELGEALKNRSCVYELPVWDKKHEKWERIIIGTSLQIYANIEADARAKMWLYLKKEGLL